MIRVAYLDSGEYYPAAIYFSPNQFLGEVLSSESEKASEKGWCTSIVTRVPGAGALRSPTDLSASAQGLLSSLAPVPPIFVLS